MDSSISAIKKAAMKNVDNFRYEGKPSCATTKSMSQLVIVGMWQDKLTRSNMCSQFVF